MSSAFRRALALVAVSLVLAQGAPVAAQDSPGPYSGGPTHYFTAATASRSPSASCFPTATRRARRYPTILEMAGYENGSASSDGRTMLGQTKDFLCAQSPDPEQCPEEEPPLADDSHHGTSAFRYDDEYVTVHASLPGTGCSRASSRSTTATHAKAGAELIDEWIPKQPWSNGKVGLLGHSYSRRDRDV